MSLGAELRDAGRDLQRPDLVDLLRPDRERDAVGEELGVVAARLGQDHGELVAADPAGDVGRADDAAHPLGDLGEHAVAGEVPDPVVDPLEVVEVEHDQRDVALVAPGARDLAPEELVEEPPVVEAGERVELGVLARLGEADRVPDRRARRGARGPRARPRSRSENAAPRRARDRGERPDRLAVGAQRHGQRRARELGALVHVVEAVAVDDLDRPQVGMARHLEQRALDLVVGQARRARRAVSPSSSSPIAISAASTPGSATTASSVRSMTSSGSSEAASSDSCRRARGRAGLAPRASRRVVRTTTSTDATATKRSATDDRNTQPRYPSSSVPQPRTRRGRVILAGIAGSERSDSPHGCSHATVSRFGARPGCACAAFCCRNDPFRS